MNIKRGLEWLKAFGECFPRAKCRGLKSLLAGFSGEAWRWEIGLDSADKFCRISLRCFGFPQARALDFGRFRRRASTLVPNLLQTRPLPPPVDIPWLSLGWNLKKDALEDACLYSGVMALKPSSKYAAGIRSDGKEIILHAQPFSKGWLKDASLANAFSGLFPVRRIVTEWEMAPGGKPVAREKWALIFQESVPWPRFICSNLADPFLPESSQMTYLLLNGRVSEISFQGGALCVYFGA